MPIWLRKFTFHKMKEHYDTQSGANSDDYIVNEGATPNPNKPNNTTPPKRVEIPKAVQQAASYNVRGGTPKK